MAHDFIMTSDGGAPTCGELNGADAYAHPAPTESDDLPEPPAASMIFCVSAISSAKRCSSA